MLLARSTQLYAARSTFPFRPAPGYAPRLLGRDWFVYDRSLARILHAGPCWPGPLDTAAFCLLACTEAARPSADYDWLPVSSHQLIQFPSLNTWPGALPCIA